MWITCGAQGVEWGIRVVYDVRLYYVPKVYGGMVLYIGGGVPKVASGASKVASGAP